MPGKWKRRLDLFVLVMYCVLMVCTAIILAAENLWWMALAQMIAISLLVKYFREARKARS